MFCTWKKKVSTSLGSQTSKHFPLEIWQWICFFNYLYRQPKSASHKFKNHRCKRVFCSEFIGIPSPLHNLSQPPYTPYFPFLSGICTQVCVWTFFCDFSWLLPQLIWKQYWGNCWVFAQGRVGSQSLCVEPVFGSCRVGCVYGASVLGRNFLS